jgi:hypothetical protein
VPTHEQGLILLKALAAFHRDHVVVMRARFKRYENYEERFIGQVDSERFDKFMGRVEHMGGDEPTQADEGDSL